MNSFNFRTNPLFLRNGFESGGKYDFPIIHRQSLETKDLQLISYSDTSADDKNNLNNGVHFFIDDYRFESIYRYPEKSLERLKKYQFVITPDYSLYCEMPLWRQIESVGKSRWVGAYWQANNMTVVPSVSWSRPVSYDFSYDCIERGSAVAIAMIGCKRSKRAFLTGYYEMLRQIDPSIIICFGKPFEEMEGNIIEIDYISSRKVSR